MESFFSRFRNPLVLIALLLTQAVLLAVQIRRPADALHPDAGQVRLLRLWTLSLISPFERASTGTGHGVRAAWADYIDLRHVRAENQELKRQMGELRLQRAELAEDALVGQRLEALEKFQAQYVTKTVAAQVIGTSGSDQSRTLTLNKGAEDGLAPDMAVITPDGIVGKLRDVFPHTAQLLLINDQTAGAGVILAATRIRAVVKGNGQGRVVINNLTPDSRIKAGDAVLTSGGDQVFPRGLPVGVVESIKSDPEHQPYSTIALKTAANLNQLEEVLVITGTSAKLDGQTQGELAGEAQMHAADVSAARLPGLMADKPEGAEASGSPAEVPDENSTKLVPKPKPVLHPDRYSPGVTAPATELSPGAAEPGPAAAPAPPPATVPPAGER